MGTLRALAAAAALALATLVVAPLGGCVAPPPVDPVEAPDRAAPVGLDETGDPAHTGDHTGESGHTGETGETGAAEGPPVLVVVLSDDLGDNYLWAMDAVTTRLEPASVRFTRAYSTVPLCCPVRASFLQGGFYPGQTGVLSNDLPNGGIARFHDADTLATRLQANGWATALVGKYLNGYEDGVYPYVPPGWDLFLVPASLGDFTDAQLVRGSSGPDAAGEGVMEDTSGAHLTGWLFDEALAFVDAHPDEPVFVLLTPQSPHIYGTPAAEDLGTWDGYSPRPPAFDEEDVSDKPAFVRRIEVDDVEIASWDAETQLMMENLASLDRAMGALLDGLEARGLAGRTTLVFTGDNGHLHGEHRLTSKGVPYEEAVRVPLLVRAPGLAPRSDARLVAMNLDLPATVAELAGLPPAGEGASLVPALADPTLALRDHVYVDGSSGSHPVWAGVVTERWKYVEWGNGDRELYDLAADPWELESVHAAPPEDVDVAALAAWVDEHRPLNVTTTQVPVGTLGEPYEATLEAWGGTPPLSWALESGLLPAGLTLSAEGVVSGAPAEVGSYIVQVRVTDAGVSPATGAAQTFGQSLRFTIGAGATGGRAPAARDATAARDGGDALFVLPARPGARVGVRLHLDDTRDTPPLRVAAGVAGEDGVARVRIAGVEPGRPWRWSWTVDGVVVPGGALPVR